MSFSFNFSGDDIDESIEQDSGAGNVEGGAEVTVADTVPAVDVMRHDLRELLSTLPSQIHYASTTITSPTNKTLTLPRRELYDIKLQLISEDAPQNDSTLSSLSTSDLRPNLYEGGFKTWECSLDLSSLLLDRGPRKDIDDLHRCDHVVELGAGSALPSLTLFQHALRQDISVTFSLADFNAEVLRLVTLPNVLLTWARFRENPLIGDDGDGDLEITDAVLEMFTTELAQKGIELNFISGPWSPALTELVPRSAPEMGTLVLAAETIYSPASTTAFVQVLVELLQRTKMAKAVVAAKRIYFGVGGSVDLMKEMCAEKGAVAYEVENAGIEGMDAGVGRALVEVQMF